MSGALLLCSLFVTVCTSAVPKDIHIGPKVTCGKPYLVAQEEDFRLYGTGDSPSADCSFTFEAESLTEPDCKPAICYMFDSYAYFTNPKASLSIESGTSNMTYSSSNNNFEKGPVCTDHVKLEVTLRQADGYVFDKKRPEKNYKFRLSVFHKCGAKGSVQNKKFEDVIDHAKGYHQTGQKEENERSVFVAGILLGFGLASIFLVVLLLAYCYTRNSPNRPPGRSVGMPKVGGFKKKMKPNQSSEPKEVEMGVRYQPHGDRDPEKQPESDPLLSRGASDPEKPPLDTEAVTVAVDEVDEKKPKTEQVDKDLEKMEKASDNKETVEKVAEGDNSGGGDIHTGGGYSNGDTHTGGGYSSGDTHTGGGYSSGDTHTGGDYSGGGGGGSSGGGGGSSDAGPTSDD